jgi:hypothetical protein
MGSAPKAGAQMNWKKTAQCTTATAGTANCFATANPIAGEATKDTHFPGSLRSRSLFDVRSSEKRSRHRRELAEHYSDWRLCVLHGIDALNDARSSDSGLADGRLVLTARRLRDAQRLLLQRARQISNRWPHQPEQESMLSFACALAEGQMVRP